MAIFLVAGVFAEPDSEPNPEGKSDADALAHYRYYGYWPTWYTGYYLTHPYYYGHYLGKRSADSEPAAITKADSEALTYYYAHGLTWPAGYTGYYYNLYYPLGGYYYGK